MEQSPTAAKCFTIRRSILRLVATVRQQRAFLRIDHRVGQLEERLNIAFVHTADQADILVEFKTTITTLRAVLARPLLELD